MTNSARTLLKYFRIAWTAFFAMAAVLLCVLWVRSCYALDAVEFPMPLVHGIETYSLRGEIQLSILWTQHERVIHRWTVKHREVQRNEALYGYDGGIQFPLNDRGTFAVCMPDSYVIVPLLIVSALPWLRWRYSLRTLLITTTLVAVVLRFMACVLK